MSWSKTLSLCTQLLVLRKVPVFMVANHVQRSQFTAVLAEASRSDACICLRRGSVPVEKSFPRSLVSRQHLESGGATCANSRMRWRSKMFLALFGPSRPRISRTRTRGCRPSRARPSATRSLMPACPNRNARILPPCQHAGKPVDPNTSKTFF